jgi:putative holliday junction resolvase
MLAPGTRLLGLDLGSKTIGLAISDPGLQVASPIDTIRRTKFTQDAITLEGFVAERRVGGLVIGLPINMDGSEGGRCQSTRQFAANLIAAVERFLIDEADMRRNKRALVIDKMAAGYILQGALDRLRRILRDREGHS